MYLTRLYILSLLLIPHKPVPALSLMQGQFVCKNAGSYCPATEMFESLKLLMFVLICLRDARWFWILSHTSFLGRLDMFYFPSEIYWQLLPGFLNICWCLQLHMPHVHSYRFFRSCYGYISLSSLAICSFISSST